MAVAPETATSLRHALEAALSAGHDEESLRAAVATALALDQKEPSPDAVPEPEPEAAAVPQIIMDCDPGGDDVFALVWLLALRKQGVCDVRAVTTTEGNVKAPLTFAAADKVLQLFLSADVDVCAQTPADSRNGDRGARTVARQAYAEAVAEGAGGSGDGFSDAAHIHGCDGMGGLSQRLASGDTRYTEAEESYERLIRELDQHPGEITILATGPLTNLADAERARPGVLRKARRIVIMGGALPGTRGNITPLAEFNFAFDAPAAALVMEDAGLEDIVLMPLDVTTKLVCTDSMVTDSLLEGRNVADGSQLSVEGMYEPTVDGAGRFLYDLSSFMFKTALQFKETDGRRGFLVHDASTILALFYPECLQFTRAMVSVAVSEPKGRRHGIDTNGMSFIDRRHCPKLEANCWVGVEIDAAGALSIMIEDLKQLLSTMPHAIPAQPLPIATDAVVATTAAKVPLNGAAPA